MLVFGCVTVKDSNIDGILEEMFLSITGQRDVGCGMWIMVHYVAA